MAAYSQSSLKRGLTPSFPLSAAAALAQRLPVGPLEQVGQDLAIGLIRHYLQFVHHVGDVVEAILGRSRRRGGNLGAEWGPWLRSTIFRFPHFAVHASAGTPENSGFSLRFLSLRNLMKCDEYAISANGGQRLEFDMPQHFHHVLRRL